MAMEQNDSGMNDCEEWHYHHELVCVYCGNDKGDKLSCCGECHFDTQFNMDLEEKEWHERNRNLINSIHNVVETQIKQSKQHPF